MAIALASKPGITGANTLAIPKDWDPTWFRNFINNQLKGADVRNAVGTNGIKVSGNISSPYATITIGVGPIVIPAGATGPTLTVNGASDASAIASFVGPSNGGAYIKITNAQGGNYSWLIGVNLLTANGFSIENLTGGATTPFNITTAGNVVIGTPTSGAALTATALAGQPVITVSAGPILQNSSASGTVGLTMNSVGANFGNIGNVSSQLWQLGYSPSITGIGTAVLKWNTTAGGLVFIGDGTNTTSALAGGGRATIQLNSSTDGAIEFSNNGNVLNGYIYCSTSEMRLAGNTGVPVNFYSNNALRATLSSAGGIFMAGATGGDKGVGTINATGLFINGAAVSTSTAPLIAVKAAATPRASTTVLANDPDLVIAIPGAGTYAVEAVIGHYNTGSSAIGISFNLNYSGTFTANSSLFSALNNGNPANASSLITATVVTPLDSGSTGVAIGNATTLIEATLVATGAGTLGFAWAQNSSNVTATNVGAGSRMTALKIA